MFGLLHNLYKYIKKKRERKITIVLLGLDGAGKTTLLNSLQGDAHSETSPTFGFKSETLREGKYTVDVFDLGGGKNIRKIWKNYLADIHGAIFVVDASDSARFEEAKLVLEQVLVDPHLSEKPLVVFANKQDLPTAKPAHEVANSLGLANQLNHPFNILPCTAKTANGQPPDASIRTGYKWLIGSIDSAFNRLNPRVVAEAEQARAEELKRKQERDERVKKAKEERLRQQKEEEQREQQVPPVSRQVFVSEAPMTPLYEAKPLSALGAGRVMLAAVAESSHIRPVQAASPPLGDKTFLDVAGAVAQMGESSRGSSIAYASVPGTQHHYSINGPVTPSPGESQLPSCVEDAGARGGSARVTNMSHNKISPLAISGTTTKLPGGSWSEGDSKTGGGS